VYEKLKPIFLLC